MNQDILVSVIVPVYNVEEYLGRCVDSILTQTYQNLEVILVDDGAKDGSGAICDAYAAKDSRVRVIHKENGGLSSARNAGIDIARGEYLEFVDSDDWLEPDAVESLLREALTNQTELVVGGRWDVKATIGQKQQGLCPPRQEVLSGEKLVSRIFRWDHCDSSACDKLFAKRLFREARFPQGVVCEDVPVMYKIVLDAGRIAMLPKPIYNYYHRSGSITYTSVSDKNFHFARHTEEILSYIQAHYHVLEQEARYLRVRSLVYAVQSVDLASEEDRKRFCGPARDYRKALRRQIPFVVTSALFGRKEKVTDVLLAFNLYRSLRRIFSKQR
ncbi:MAG: glycosyltransferase family 2 protein [Faecousia sp.]